MKELGTREETEKWAKEFARGLKRPALILLDGELGAGKTQLVRWFVEALGGAPASSPTFAIHQTYDSPNGDIEHVDLYRLESPADLESTGFWDLLRQPRVLMFVEWADKLPGEIWPRDIKTVHLRVSKLEGDEGRRIVIA